MVGQAPSKHQLNSARTRERIIEAAEQLYGSRSIDAVSLREITATAGQKNPNALQYHFKNREGLLQAIIDKHSLRVGELREDYFERAEQGEWPPAEAAARCLVLPIVDYVDANPGAENFVKINSQIVALYQSIPEREAASGIRWPNIPRLREILDAALGNLPTREAHRRRYLAVNITFHSIADIYRVSGAEAAGERGAADRQMVEQLICLLGSFFAAPAITR